MDILHRRELPAQRRPRRLPRLEVRDDVGYGGLRWIKVGPADQTGTSIVLQSPAPLGCGVTDEERRMIVEMMAKGTYAGINLATAGSRSGALE